MDLTTIKAQHKLNNQADRITIPQAFLDKFPNLKRDKAGRLFHTYVEAVASVLIKQLPYAREGICYITTHGLLNQCADFYYEKKRYWVWNEFKDLYPFFTVLQRGSNLTATTNPYEKNTKVQIHARPIMMLLEERSPQTVYDSFYDDADLAHPDCDLLDIDMANLVRFIGNCELQLEQSTEPAYRAKVQRNLTQATLILKIGQHTEVLAGSPLLPLVPSPSPFGRMGYKGMSIHNVSKQVRSALLGRHYQYDMNAAVFAFKLTAYGEAMGGTNNIIGTKLGTYTREYLAEKNRIRKRLAKECFAGTNAGEELALRAIKDALTAIGFGARSSGHMWLGSDGKLQGTALAEIITSQTAREAFLADAWVRNFMAEQKVMEEAIIEAASAHPQYNDMCNAIKAANGANGRVTAAGKMAWLYQHWETAMMDRAVEVLEQHGIEVIARVHDALILRDELSDRVLDDIASAWGLNSYMTMDGELIREWIDPDFKRALIAADADLAEHKRTMETAEKQALIYSFKMREARGA